MSEILDTNPENVISLYVSFEPDTWADDDSCWKVPCKWTENEIEQMKAALNSNYDNYELNSGQDELRQKYPAIYEQCDKLAHQAIIDICGAICPEPLPEVYWIIDGEDICPEDDSCDGPTPIIEGDGNVRHLQYLLGDKWVEQHWLILHDKLTFIYKMYSVDGGYANRYSNIDIAPLLHFFDDCLPKDLIDHIMKHCKRNENLICLDVFMNLLKQLHVSYIPSSDNTNEQGHYHTGQIHGENHMTT